MLGRAPPSCPTIASPGPGTPLLSTWSYRPWSKWTAARIIAARARARSPTAGRIARPGRHTDAPWDHRHARSSGSGRAVLVAQLGGEQHQHYQYPIQAPRRYQATAPAASAPCSTPEAPRYQSTLGRENHRPASIAPSTPVRLPASRAEEITRKHHPQQQQAQSIATDERRPDAPGARSADATTVPAPARALITQRPRPASPRLSALISPSNTSSACRSDRRC